MVAAGGLDNVTVKSPETVKGAFGVQAGRVADKVVLGVVSTLGVGGQPLEAIPPLLLNTIPSPSGTTVAWAKSGRAVINTDTTTASAATRFMGDLRG
jgi:hypothetical protein